MKNGSDTKVNSKQVNFMVEESNTMETPVLSAKPTKVMNPTRIS